MGVHIREIYPGRWYLRITYKNIRKTKAAGSKERAIDLKKKLTTALDMLDYSMIKRWVIRMSGTWSSWLVLPAPLNTQPCWLPAR